jgi:ketosteroid isomerase-like protein
LVSVTPATDAENAGFVRRAYEAWDTLGLREIEPLLAKNVELQDAPELPDSGTWRGRPAVVARLEEVRDAIGGGSVTIEEVRANGAEVLVQMDWELHPEAGGTSVGTVYHVVRVSGREIDRLRVFIDESQAHAAAGLVS